MAGGFPRPPGSGEPLSRLSAKPFYDHPALSAERLKDLFALHDVRVAIIGGLAALHYRAEPWHTVDADFVINRLGDLDDA